jgi:hypothetical protein
MSKIIHAGYKIKSLKDGSLYTAQVERSDGSEFQVRGRAKTVWQTPQSETADAAIGQAIYAIDTGKLK